MAPRTLGGGAARPPRPALGTMGVGARGAWAALILGALLVLALLKAAVDSAGLDGRWRRGASAGPPGGGWVRGKLCASQAARVGQGRGN